MKVGEIISKLRVGQFVEIRKNNNTVIRFHSDDIGAVNQTILDKEVDNWGVANDEPLFRYGTIFVDFVEEDVQ